MNWDFESLRTFAIIIHLLSLLTIAIIGFFVITRLKSAKREYFILIAFFTFISKVGIILEMMANTVDGGLLGWRLVYLGGMLLAPSFLMFVQKYCEIHLPKVINILIFATAFMIIALTWTTHLHPLIIESAQLYPGGSPGPGLTIWGATNGVLWPIVVIHPTICMVLVFFILIKKSRTATKTQQRRLWILVVFAAPPAVSQVLTFFNLSFMGMHWNGILAPIALLILYLGLSKYDLLENEETIRAQNWLRDMVTNISHDLKTPLTIVNINLQKLAQHERGLSAEEMRQYVDLAYNKSLDLERLIKNLFEVSRIEAGNSPYKPEWISLNGILSQLDDKYGGYLESRGLDFAVANTRNLGGEIDTEIYADKDRIWSAFDNVIYNAARHTEKGGVTVSAKVTDKTVTITISDTGEGIAKEHLPQIFDRFYKVSKSRGATGSGVGLYIVKSVMDNFDGDVAITSELGKGTEVKLTFVRKPQATAK